MGVLEPGCHSCESWATLLLTQAVKPLVLEQDQEELPAWSLFYRRGVVAARVLGQRG